MKPIAFACAVLIAAASVPALGAGSDPLAPIGIGPQPEPLAPQPVTETLFGARVTDNYRFMEALDANTIDWMKAEGAYSRDVLDAIKPLAALQARVAAFTGSFGVVQGYATYGGVEFYEERTPGADNFDLMARDAKGTRKLVDVAALRAQHGGEPYAINYFNVSPDGSQVVVGVSTGGSEDASAVAYDVKTGAQIGGPIDRAEYGVTDWSADSRTAFLMRLKKLGPNDPETEKLRDVTLNAWIPGTEPVPLFGTAVGHGPKMPPDDAPALLISPGKSVAMLSGQEGTGVVLWVAPASKATDPATRWTLLASMDDQVTDYQMRGDEIFLLSHKGAPTFKVLLVKAGNPLGSAEILVPADPARIVETIRPAADALYVTTREGGYSHLLRVPTGSMRVEEVALPVKGHISEIFADPRRPGVYLALENWVMPHAEFHYAPDTKTFTDMHLGSPGNFMAEDFKLSELEAKARDGVMVPLSLLQPVATKGPQVTVMEAYGAYGEASFLVDFSPRKAAMAREGIAYALCHVRGGGELGEAWRLAGKDANKHNSWQDLIACSENLIARGITTRDKLVIWGGSAGGITIGRAMTERPDLFAGVIDVAPAANTLRLEFMPAGPSNISEFGTIADPQGSKNLYEMDSVAHVTSGTAYPPVMICTGLKDPRVAPWHPAKFAAALQASGTPNPVLLRVDGQAGHGVGATRNQDDLLIADWIAFAKWRAGMPGWRPGQ